MGRSQDLAQLAVEDLATLWLQQASHAPPGEGEDDASRTAEGRMAQLVQSNRGAPNWARLIGKQQNVLVVVLISGFGLLGCEHSSPHS